MNKLGNPKLIKLQIPILLVVIVACLSLAIIFQSNYKKSLYGFYKENNKILSKQITSGIASFMASVKDLAKPVLEDTNLNYILSKEKINYDDYLYLKNSSEQIAFSSRFIRSIYIHNERSGQIYSSIDGLFELADFPDKSYLSHYYDFNERISILDTRKIDLYSWDEDEALCFSVLSILPLTGQSQIGSLLINLNQKEFFDSTIMNYAADYPVSIYIVNSLGQIIITNQEELITTRIDNLYDYENDKNLVFNHQLDGTDWSAWFIYNDAHISSSILNTQKLIIFSSLLLSLIAFFLLMLISRNTLKPIEEDNTRLSQENEEMFPVFRDNFLRALLAGHIDDPEIIQERLDHFSIKIRQKNLYIAVILWNPWEPQFEKNHENKIKELSLFFKEENVIFFIIESKNLNHLLVFESLGELSRNLELLTRLIKRLESDSQFSIKIYLSDLVKQLGNISQEYRKTERIHNYTQDGEGETEILLIKDIFENNIVYPEGVEQKVLFALQKGNLQEVKKHTGNLLGLILRDNSQFHVEYNLLRFLNALTNSVVQILDSSIINLLDLGILIKETQDKDYRIRLEKYFYNLEEDIICFLEEKRKSSRDKYAVRIIDYIKENYTKLISINQLVDEIQISPTYINRILKEHVNKSFVQFINEYRISMAELKLQDTDKTIKEIAYETGFSSSRYFIIVFKSIKGITPGRFREIL